MSPKIGVLRAGCSNTRPWLTSGCLDWSLTALISPATNITCFIPQVSRNFSPVALFLLLGLPIFLWGSFFGWYLWAQILITGEAAPTGSIMLAFVSIVPGFQLRLQAIVLDIQETPR